MTDPLPAILDASAILALLQDEPGGDEVERALDGAHMSYVNLSEVLQKAEQHGVDTEGLEYDLEALGIHFHPFDGGAARPTAALWQGAPSLSLGDRACLQLAGQLAGVAVTADQRWDQPGHGVTVQVIRGREPRSDHRGKR